MLIRNFLISFFKIIILHEKAIIKDIFEEANNDFNQIFNKSIAQLNSNQFFESLKTFFGDYPIDIEHWIQIHFIKLAKFLFNMMNGQHEQYQNIEKCLEDNFEKIEPFGSKLLNEITKQLIKSIDSVKIFTSGLTKTRDLIIDVSSRFLNPSADCKRTLTQMTKCSLCLNNTLTMVINNNKMSSVKPCYSYCLDVYKNCLVADLEQLDVVWNTHLSKYLIFF